jgi:hypothetical protein
MDKDFTLVFNPKYLDVNGKKTINTAKVIINYGKRENERPEGRLLERPAVYTINPSEIKKFRSDIARYLLKMYGFLRMVEPRDLDKVLEETKEKAYKCPLCDFETDTKLALAGHKTSHKLSEEAQKILAEIPEATPAAYVIGAENSPTHQTQIVSIEQAEGIPETNGHTAKDKDNVEWYGEGLETNRTKNGMHRAPRGATPGQAPVYKPNTL